MMFISKILWKHNIKEREKYNEKVLEYLIPYFKVHLHKI